MNLKKKEQVSFINEDYEPDEVVIKHKRKQPSSNVIDTKTTLTEKQIEEFFQATEDGSVERLEELFNEKRFADPNMTHFTESLLMAAIRTQRYDVAEYLIDQLRVNVEYSADLHEFRPRSYIPIRHRTFSCRDLAYEKGMMELVDIIDITSDDVKPNIKRFLQKRLQSRLDNIHQTYLKHSNERNNISMLQSNEENKETPTVNVNTTNGEANIKPLTILPNIHRPFKSRIEEVMENLQPTNNKSIDEAGKKTFRFSNYALHFRLVEGTDTKEKSQLKTTIPSLPIIPLATSPSPPLTSRRSISDASTRLSIRDSRTSVSHSARRKPIPQLVPIENKPITTNTNKHFLSNKIKRNNLKHGYIPQQQHTIYTQPRCFLPVTLKTTAVGLPSDHRILRD